MLQAVDLEWRPLDVATHAARMAGIDEAIRVTTPSAVFEESCESHQFFSPGGQLFDLMSCLLRPVDRCLQKLGLEFVGWFVANAEVRSRSL